MNTLEVIAEELKERGIDAVFINKDLAGYARPIIRCDISTKQQDPILRYITLGTTVIKVNHFIIPLSAPNLIEQILEAIKA